MSMTAHQRPDSGVPGDWVEVRGLPGQRSWRGEIVEVLGPPDHIRYRVRWDDEYESLLIASDRVIVHHSDPTL